MGREVEFSTGFEYKFAVARQPTDDLYAFGGTHQQNFVIWKNDFKGLDSQELSILENFAPNVEGTGNLQMDCIRRNVSHKMTLGLLIAHQLRYTNELRAHHDDYSD